MTTTESESTPEKPNVGIQNFVLLSAQMTETMKKHNTLAGTRRTLALKLVNEDGVKPSDLAKAAGVSTQAVYRLLEVKPK